MRLAAVSMQFLSGHSRSAVRRSPCYLLLSGFPVWLSCGFLAAYPAKRGNVDIEDTR
jgi:hypothetical protein|tara:strand:- start:7205 stop:7375 length:171 start_codon:yes stop_codon:yes gene_type:complete